MASLELNNSEILRGLALIMGIPRDTSDWTTDEQEDARAVIRSGLRKFFQPLTPDGRIHQWRFLERNHTDNGEDVYETGTIAATAGVVTLTGGTFPSWVDDGLLRYDGEAYYVESLDNSPTNTQITLYNKGLDITAGSSYELFRWRYPLPSDFAEFIDGMVLHDGINSRRLQGSTEDEIRLRHATNWQYGSNLQPTRYAVFAGDTNTDSNDSNWYYGVWPIMTSGQYASGTYRRSPPDNLEATITDGGTTVQIDPVHAETLIAAIMSAAEEYMNDEGNGVHTIRFRSRIQASIQHDRSVKGPIGFNVPEGVNRRALSLFYHTPDYTYGEVGSPYPPY